MGKLALCSLMLSAAAAFAEPLNLTAVWHGRWAVFKTDLEGTVTHLEMNLTASRTGEDPADAVLTLSGSLAMKANADAGVMADEVINSVSVVFEPRAGRGEGEEEEEEEAEDENAVAARESMTTLRWLQGEEGEVPTETLFTVPLSVAAPGVLMGSANGASATIAAPKFVSILLASGEKLVLRKQDDAPQKTWQQLYGTPLMLGAIFIVNMVMRFYMNSGGGGLASLLGGSASPDAVADAPSATDAPAVTDAATVASKASKVKSVKGKSPKGKAKAA